MVEVLSSGTGFVGLGLDSAPEASIVNNASMRASASVKGNSPARNIPTIFPSDSSGLRDVTSNPPPRKA